MSQNLQRQLDSIIGTKSKQFASPTLFGTEKMAVSQGSKGYMPSFSSGTTILDNLKQISISSRVFYILISIFVVLFILIAIHLFVYPFLPNWVLGTQLPGMNDEKVYWNTQASKEPILPVDQPISDISHDYTFMFDIQVDNPTTRLGQHRIFLNRGNPVTTNERKLKAYQQDSGEGNIQSLVPDFNFIVYFDKGSTDLYIGTILNGNTQSPKVIIRNFPIQKSVRIAVVLMNKAMEVYLNGELYATQSFAKSVKSTKGTIYPPTIDSGTAPFGRLHNLRLWRRTLGVSEIRNYGSGTSFDKVDITDTCIS
jgi:hypothetical protein